MTHYSKHVFVCTNQKDVGKACCANTGGEAYCVYLKTQLKRLGQHGPGKIRISRSGCLGRCSEGPCIVVYPEGVWYRYHDYADVDEIIQEHLLSGKTVTRLLMADASQKTVKSND